MRIKILNIETDPFICYLYSQKLYSLDKKSSLPSPSVSPKFI